MSMNFELPKLKCLRCGHEWVPRRPTKPKVCPKCTSPYWDIPRGQKRGPKGGKK